MRTKVHHLLREAAAAHGRRPALTCGDDTVTYAQLWDLVTSAARGLRGCGLSRDDRVAVFLDKRVESVAAIYATWASGGVVVPVNSVLRAPQVAYILADCGVSILITTSARYELLRSSLGQLPALRQVILTDDDSWRDLLRHDGAAVRDQSTVDVDMAAVLYTSGSTGLPKGVVLSHRNLIVGADSVNEYLATSADDVLLSVLPLSFDAGLSQLTTACAAGAHVVLLNYLVADDVVQLCGKHQVTGLTCVPPLWIQLAEQDWPREASRSLRYFANTGGALARGTLDRLRAHFPQATPFLMYGLTEAFRSTYLDPAEIDRRPNSIGKAVPNAEILVLRPDGSACAPGEPGELVHRGALVAMGYWNDPQRTKERFRPAPKVDDDFRPPEIAVYSGDIVVADDDGFLYFVGRVDEMIKTSGYRVSPSEIEDVAAGTGLVRDVVAFGIADPRLGQRIVLAVSPPRSGTVDTRRLRVLMRQRLPSYMVPTSVHVYDDIPTLPNGKIDRATLRMEVTE